MCRWPVALGFLLCSLGAPLTAALPADVQRGALVDGESFRGKFVGIDTAGGLRFDGDGPPRVVPPSDLVHWGGFVEPGGGMQIVLADGGVIVVESARIDKEQLLATSPTLGAVKLPLELMSGVLLRPPGDLPTRDTWLARIASPGGQTDRVLLDNGDELTGTVAGWDDKSVTLESDTGQVAVGAEKISALIFNPTLVHRSRATGPRVLAGLADGSRVTAVELATDKDRVRLKLAGGAELSSPSEALLALVSLGGRVTYLSDLKPASYRHVPFLQLEWPYHADRSVLGGQLRAAGHVYAKGLGMHSPSRITFDLARPFRRFEAELAIDAEAGERGSVVCRVFTDDGSSQWQERATTEVIRGGQPPVPISVDLSGAKRISLLVDYADRGDELDHVDWLNVRLLH